MSWRANATGVELPIERAPSRGAPRAESRRPQGGIPEHPLNSPHRLSSASEQDVCILSRSVATLEVQVRQDLDEEIHARKNGDTSLGRRCDALERALTALQREHGDLRRERGSDATQRIHRLEGKFDAWADRHARDAESTRRTTDRLSMEAAGLADSHERHLEVAEQTANAMTATRTKIDHLSAGVLGCEQRCAAVESRVSSFEANAREADRRLGGCLKDLDGLRREHASDSSQVKQQFAEVHDLILHHAETHKASLKGAVAGLASDRENTAKALAAAQARLDQVHQAAQNCESRLPGLADRLGDAERRLDGHASEHQSLAQHVKQRHAELHDLVHRHASDHQEHMERTVQTLQSSADQTAKALAAAQARLDRMQDGAGSCEQRCADVESKANSLAERFKESERRIEVTVSQTVEELAVLKSECSRLALQVKQKLTETPDLLRHISEHRARLDGHEEQNGILAARHDGQARDLTALRDDHSKQVQEIWLLRRHVEGALGEMAHNTSQELRATRDELEQVLLLLAGVQKAWRPAAARGARTSRRNRSEEAGTPKTPKAGFEVSVDLMKPGMEEDAPPASRPQLL